MKEVIHTSNAPAAIGPYSQAIKAGGAIYVSGQLPVDPATGAFAGDTIQEQTRQSLTNIKNILAEAGTDLDHVVRVDVFMKDMNMFADMNAVYAEFFTEKCPARAAVEVARLPKDALVEIGAIAVVDYLTTNYKRNTSGNGLSAHCFRRYFFYSWSVPWPYQKQPSSHRFLNFLFNHIA